MTVFAVLMDSVTTVPVSFSIVSGSNLGRIMSERKETILTDTGRYLGRHVNSKHHDRDEKYEMLFNGQLRLDIVNTSRSEEYYKISDSDYCISGDPKQYEVFAMPHTFSKDAYTIKHYGHLCLCTCFKSFQTRLYSVSCTQARTVCESKTLLSSK